MTRVIVDQGSNPLEDNLPNSQNYSPPRDVGSNPIGNYPSDSVLRSGMVNVGSNLLTNNTNDLATYSEFRSEGSNPLEGKTPVSDSLSSQDDEGLIPGIVENAATQASKELLPALAHDEVRSQTCGSDALPASGIIDVSECLLKQVNHAVISLIPKSKHAPEAKDFRLISCCNVFYETISKLLASKLAAVIPKIIDPAQGAFIEERLMSDNILLAQQLIRKYGRSMLMVDLRKEFDTLSWSFLLSLL